MQATELIQKFVDQRPYEELVRTLTELRRRKLPMRGHIPHHLFYKSKPTRGIDRAKVEDWRCVNFETCLELSAKCNLSAVPCLECRDPKPPPKKYRKRRPRKAKADADGLVRRAYR